MIGQPIPSAILATLNIHNAADLSPETRDKLATWLRRQANALVKEGQNYSPRFRARYEEVRSWQRHLRRG
jgi:hypothetical protein